MQAIVLLHSWLNATCPMIHTRRLEALLTAVGGLWRGGRLTLTDLGRSLPGSARSKHAIKRVDRLLGNRHLHRERRVIYQAMAAWLLRQTPRPVLLVDWSELNSGGRYLVLKAALAFKGRALTLYEEVHPLSSYNTPRIHRQFLNHLADVVVPECRPIIVTDAGFRGPWFREVEQLGWDWVGRVRNKVHYRLDADDQLAWEATTRLYSLATPTVKTLGTGWLSKKSPYRCTLYVIRKYRPKRGRSKRCHGHSATAQRCRQQYKDPWLLATSLSGGEAIATQVVRLYALRMQVEHTFRDDKGQRWGWQLDYTGSRSAARLAILLLIGALATFVAWLVGLAADRHNRTRELQVNTVRDRRVLSVVFVGRYWLRWPPPWLDENTVFDSIMSVPERLAETVDFVGIP